MPPPTTKSIEQLLALVEKEEKKPNKNKVEYEPVDDALNFLLSNNIKSGIERVNYFLLYKMYKSWSKDPLDSVLFHSKLKDYLKHGKSRTFYINKNAHILSSDYYKRITQKKVKTDILKSAIVFEFAQAKNFKRGPKYFKAYIFYEMFLAWARARKYRKISYRIFVKVLKTVLNHKQTLESAHYFGITEDLRETYLTKEREISLNKKYNIHEQSNAKKQNKKSSS